MITASLDFGTTNSVAGVNIDGKIEMIPLGKKELETKTVLFYSFEDKKFYVGDEAIEELELETLGRYLVSLKSFLGSKESVETTLGTTTYMLEDLISIIIRRFKAKIEAHIGQSVEKIVLGRPVRFKDDDDVLDQLAQERLEKAALQAGFKEVKFLYEPIAAAIAYEKQVQKEELVLVADIGGGTTDYTIVRVGGKKKLERKEDILATNGVYVGGNSFDTQIIRNFVTEHLGEGSLYKNMGKEMSIGPHLYNDFSEWHKFQKMYDIKVLNGIEKLIFMAYDKEKISRLLELIREGLYFSFSQKIIESKAQLSFDETTFIDMNLFQDPFTQEITREAFNKVITPDIEKIKMTLDETIKMANISYDEIDRVFLTGGSTLVPAVKNLYREVFGEEKLVHTDVFSSVGYGLALYAGEVF